MSHPALLQNAEKGVRVDTVDSSGWGGGDTQDARVPPSRNPNGGPNRMKNASPLSLKELTSGVGQKSMGSLI